MPNYNLTLNAWFYVFGRWRICLNFDDEHIGAVFPGLCHCKGLQEQNKNTHKIKKRHEPFCESWFFLCFNTHRGLHWWGVFALWSIWSMCCCHLIMQTFETVNCINLNIVGMELHTSYAILHNCFLYNKMHYHLLIVLITYSFGVNQPKI